MLKTDRYSKIYNLVSSKKSVTVQYLSKKLYISEATIRRDLADMEKNNLIKRVWGGAMLPTVNKDAPLFVREQLNQDSKEKIAKIASKFLKNSCSIFMDPSSTCLPLVQYMKDLKNVVVVTNSLRVSKMVSDNTEASIIVLGGHVYEGTILAGRTVVEAVKQYHTDLMFFSCSGISASAGLTSLEPRVVEVSQEMMRHTSKKILLADSSKVGVEALLTLADITAPDYVIMEKKPDDSELVRVLGDRLITEDA